MVKISVIVPVYNTESYLRQCIDSILNQTFEDIEIICVNDGSTDGSLDILTDFEKRDTRVKVYTQENQGVGVARNRGLEYACGEYMYFMDSDDYLNDNALEDVLDIIEEKHADFVMFKIRNFNEDSGEIIDDDYYNMPYLKEAVGDETFNYSDVSKMALNLCVCQPGILFNHEFIRDIRFPEGLLFEDNVFFTEALFKAKRIVFYDEFLYNRRKHTESTTTQISLKSLDTIDITNMLLDLCDEYNHSLHKKELYYRIFINIYNIFKKADPASKEKLFEKIKENYLKYQDKWEGDDYFKNKLDPKYKHIYSCALKSKNADKFESCVESYGKESRLKKLRKKLL